MNVALIVNPEAGGGRPGRSLGAVLARMRQLGLDPVARPTENLDHARRLTHEAVAEGRAAVAFGGDGLIGTVAGALREGDGLLGVLPGGRGNDFARALGIPQDPVAACDVLAGGVERRIDLGRVGDRTFLGIASCGFDSIANEIANNTRLIRGNLVYAYGALRALLGWRPETFTIVLDDGPSRAITGYTIAAANSPFYGGGMAMAPDATLTDGMLDVVLISHIGRLRFLRLLPSVFRGGHVREPNVEVVRARSVHVTAARPLTLFADGEPIAVLPATITVEPAAVRALVPAAGGPALGDPLARAAPAPAQSPPAPAHAAVASAPTPHPGAGSTP